MKLCLGNFHALPVPIRPVTLCCSLWCLTLLHKKRVCIHVAVVQWYSMCRQHCACTYHDHMVVLSIKTQCIVCWWKFGLDGYVTSFFSVQCCTCTNVWTLTPKCSHLANARWHERTLSQTKKKRLQGHLVSYWLQVCWPASNNLSNKLLRSFKSLQPSPMCSHPAAVNWPVQVLPQCTSSSCHTCMTGSAWSI